MANSYFKFKKFTINQDKCAMKVCTDACLFGAYVADVKPSGKNFLDIGTGTGLLPLMLAQKQETAEIDAVEIDAAAAEQAKDNVESTVWADRITVVNKDILNFNSGKLYDCIISNPPFYEGDLQSADNAKNVSKHDTSLNLSQIIKFVDRNLTADGSFAVLLPYARVEYFIEEAKKSGFNISRTVLVKQTIKHKFFRGILFFGRQQTAPINSEIIIRDAEHNYTAAFTALLKDYYLFL